MSAMVKYFHDAVKDEISILLNWRHPTTFTQLSRLYDYLIKVPTKNY
jgi:hypothetical protein